MRRLQMVRVLALLGLAASVGCKRDKPCTVEPQANCAGADFSHTDLRGADFTGANLQNALFTGATLEGAKLDGANLRGADLAAASLEGAALRHADLSGAVMTAIRGARADFSHAVLNQVVIDGSFDDAVFLGATFEAALNSNCLGNAPTTFKGGPRFDPKTSCRVRRLIGRRIVCPDGHREGESPNSGVSCEGHLAR